MSDAVRFFLGTRNGLGIGDVVAGRAAISSEAFGGEIIQVVAGQRDPYGRVFVGLRDGLYVGDRDGRHWQRVLEGDVRAITVDPHDDSTVYVGTDPVHLFRSDDAGATWTEITSLQRLPEETHEQLGEFEPNDMSHSTEPNFRHRRHEWWIHPPFKGHILHIFVHPDDPDFVVVSIEHGGIALSTDRGETWGDASDGIDYLDIHFVARAPNDDRFLVSTARGLFATSDPRNGWQRAETGCDRSYFHDLCVLPTTSRATTLVATADGSPGVWRRESRGPRAAVYRSDDFGRSWDRVGVGKGLDDDSDEMVWAFAPILDDAGVVLAGVGASSGVPSPERGRGAGGLLVSHDAGDSWTRVLSGGAAVEHLFVAAS